MRGGLESISPGGSCRGTPWSPQRPGPGPADEKKINEESFRVTLI